MTLDIVIFGLSITSSWGNGHATTYRALIKALARRGHRVTFIERDKPWYREHRDLGQPDYCRVELYDSLSQVPRRFSKQVAEADLVILGSYVPDGIALADWITSRARGVTAFYDIDTPVTLANLERGGSDYLSAHVIPRFDLFLSFTGGPVLRLIEEQYGSPRARALYCAADIDQHAPIRTRVKWDLGYLGTYSPDRQITLDQLLIEPARHFPDRRFAVAGAQYPGDLNWPANVALFAHLPPHEHSEFYCAQRFTLNITRADMIATGYSPSVRLFEAAACGIPIISDAWPGLETFFRPGAEILVAGSARDVVGILDTMPDERRLDIAAAARRRLIDAHTPDRRAKDLENYYAEVLSEDASVAAVGVA
jgi:spore maturation protein CgeB